jgi:hypothetical protein
MTNPYATMQVGDFIQVDAFNLWLGAVFVKNGHAHVVMEVTDYPHTEQILVKSRIADDAEADTEDELLRPFLFHYMTQTAIIGTVRRPQDFDDNNWGSSS